MVSKLGSAPQHPPPVLHCRCPLLLSSPAWWDCRVVGDAPTPWEAWKVKNGVTTFVAEVVDAGVRREDNAILMRQRNTTSSPRQSGNGGSAQRSRLAVVVIAARDHSAMDVQHQLVSDGTVSWQVTDKCRWHNGVAVVTRLRLAPLCRRVKSLSLLLLIECGSLNVPQLPGMCLLYPLREVGHLSQDARRCLGDGSDRSADC